MSPDKGGVVVNVSSMAGKQYSLKKLNNIKLSLALHPIPYSPVYSVAKAGVVIFSRTLKVQSV